MAKWFQLSVRIASKSLPISGIERVLGKATSSVQKGDLVSRRNPNGPTLKESICTYDPQTGPSPEDQIKWAVQFFKTHIDGLKQLKSSCDIDVRVGVSAADGQLCFALSGEEMRLFADVSVCFNFDVYGSGCANE